MSVAARFLEDGLTTETCSTVIKKKILSVIRYLGKPEILLTFVEKYKCLTFVSVELLTFLSI
jgi:hypothetical protein